MDTRIKVLYKRMSEDEKSFIKNKPNNIEINRFSNHAIERMRTKQINSQDVYNVLNDYEI